ncbi:MAG TPA: hypothetical protein VGB68_18520, partial [Pyrinomonadaceae bacterium]
NGLLRRFTRKKSAARKILRAALFFRVNLLNKPFAPESVLFFIKAQKRLFMRQKGMELSESGQSESCRG